MNQILIHQDHNDYKFPRVGKLKVEKAVGRDNPMGLPCQALFNSGTLDYKYITAFMRIGKLIVVLTNPWLTAAPAAPLQSSSS